MVYTKKGRKSSLIVYIVLINFILVGACNSSINNNVDTSQMILYSSDSLRFSLYYPKHWERLNNYKNTAFVALNTKIDKDSAQFRENIILTIETIDILDEKTYLRNCVNELSIINNGASIIQNDVLINNKNAYQLDYVTKSNDEVLYSTVFIFINGNTSYILTCFCTDNMKDEYQKIFKSIASTLKIEDDIRV